MMKIYILNLQHHMFSFTDICRQHMKHMKHMKHDGCVSRTMLDAFTYKMTSLDDIIHLHACWNNYSLSEKAIIMLQIILAHVTS